MHETPGPIPPEAEYLTDWFLELHSGRTHTVVAGMGGGQVYPDPISFMEIQSWSILTESQPQPWEVRALRRMDQEYRSAKNGQRTQGSKHQAIGEYCQGAEVDACRKTFGDQLERVCSTCPN